jgi:glycolate oxidase FAD binding subunit
VASAAVTRERPGSVEEAARLLTELGKAGRPLRVRGGATKLGWRRAGGDVAVELETAGLNRILEHNEGDFTAVLQAGVPLAEAQEQFARAGQVFALDPPLTDDGGDPRATIGGVVATGDSGPLRHRYGGVRDLIVGITVVLSDGTVAKAGGRVIKNVAGYDLGKLFSGSFGTLGLIAAVAVRLHPLADSWATARALSDDPGALARAAGQLAALPIEADCLDVSWDGHSGSVLVRFGGATASDRAQTIADRVSRLGLEDPTVIEDDRGLWEGQRAAQRRADGAVIKVAGVISELEQVLRAASDAGATVVSRAAVGLSWLALERTDGLAERLSALRERLPDATVSVLDGAELVQDPWPAPAPGAVAVMERLKARFDPARVFAPGSFVGGL